MGREIKFRAFDPDSGDMYYGVSVLFRGYRGKEIMELQHPDWEEDGEPESCSVNWGGVIDPKTVKLMQFTGLKDKNGKDVFEGDLLGGIWEGSYIAWCDKCKQFQLHIFVKIKDYGPCQACEGDVHWSEIVDSDDLEIIGNIYETPDLLK